jgi:hypothetical protein
VLGGTSALYYNWFDGKYAVDIEHGMLIALNALMIGVGGSYLGSCAAVVLTASPYYNCH